MELSQKHVVIWGFGRHGGGLAAARFCSSRGARVTILDAKPREAFGSAADEVQVYGWAWQVGDGTHSLIQSADLIVASPAIPPRAWPAVHAPMTCPEGLFCAAHRGPRIAVTGTKGKSTTARILGTLLGWEVAGNSYEPLLDVLARCGSDAPIVCELSSFQLYYLAPDAPRFTVAVVTSLATDHLDWHPDLEHYQRSKLALLNMTTVGAWDDDVSVRSRDLPILLPTRLPIVQYADQQFTVGANVLAKRDDLPLLGEHNARNATLALAVARHLGVSDDVLATRLRQVQALPHRLEIVHECQGIHFINDSIATTPEAAIAGIRSMKGPLAIIVGGSDKGASWDALAAAIAQQQRIQTIFPITIGQTGPAIAAALRDHGIQSLCARTMQDAVGNAVSALPNGGTVLLSPACASFDMFQGFEDRGRQFTEYARAVRVVTTI